MPTSPASRSLIGVVLLLCANAEAATLGEARVKSFLNQPLEVEIALVGLRPGEHEDLRLRVANQEHFERLGITYDSLLADLRFDVVQIDGDWLVRALSSRPVTEPFIDFPLQMSWPGGQLIRQYTLLIDPARRVRPAAAASAAPAAAPAAQPRRALQEPTQPQRPDPYGPVKPGETLWPIAQRLRPGGITTQQMAIALLRANPQAFIDNNVNRLRAGATLAIPPLDVIQQLDAAAARAEFAAQTRPPQTLPPVATSPRTLDAMGRPAPAPAAASGPTPTPEAARPTEPEPQLRIVTEPDETETLPGTEQAMKEQLLVTMEEIESNRIATGAIESRLARLESELEDMQRLLELKDAQIEALQEEISTRDSIERAAQASEPQLAPATSSATAVAPKVAAAPAPALPDDPAAPVARLDTSLPVAPPPAVAQPWYLQYLWLPWALLGLLGLSVIWLLFRRPQEPAGAVDAELPRFDIDREPATRAESLHSAAALRQAEDDLRALDEESLPGFEERYAVPERPRRQVTEHQDRSAQEAADTSAFSDSPRDTAVDESKRLVDRPEAAASDTAISDDDIASWVAELDAETERLDIPSANDAEISLDDDIPSILNELDDQITRADPVDRPVSSGIDLEPLEETGADDTDEDTFSMSLDLARAYLEIGDQDGARDMLEQALASTVDPEHRRQIEELLQQIG